MSANLIQSPREPSSPSVRAASRPAVLPTDLGEDAQDDIGGDPP